MNPMRDWVFAADVRPSGVSNRVKRWLTLAILLLSFIGLADSAYLAQHALSGDPLICNLGEGLSGCNTVAESAYSNIFGIPLALYGVAFYAGLFILAAVELLLSRSDLRRFLQLGSVLGLLASVIFVIIQAFFIGAFCIYCLISAAVALLLFVAAMPLEKVPFPRKRTRVDPPAPPHLVMPPV